MESISALLLPEHIALDVKAKKKKAAITALVSLLHETGVVEDSSAAVREVMERERLTSTGVGEGVAIPHRLASWIEKTSIAFCRFSPPVQFDAIDNKPADLVFLLLGPAGHEGEHLRLLTRLARLLRQEDVRKQLRAATDAPEIVQILASHGG